MLLDSVAELAQDFVDPELARRYRQYVDENRLELELWQAFQKSSDESFVTFKRRNAADNWH